MLVCSAKARETQGGRGGILQTTFTCRARRFVFTNRQRMRRGSVSILCRSQDTTRTLVRELLRKGSLASAILVLVVRFVTQWSAEPPPFDRKPPTKTQRIQFAHSLRGSWFERGPEWRERALRHARARARRALGQIAVTRSQIFVS